jgi:hypothetical protein
LAAILAACSASSCWMMFIDNLICGSTARAPEIYLWPCLGYCLGRPGECVCHSLLVGRENPIPGALIHEDPGFVTPLARKNFILLAGFVARSYARTAESEIPAT